MKKYFIKKKSILDKLIIGILTIAGILSALILASDCDNLKIFVISKIISLGVLLSVYIISIKYLKIRK